MTLWKTINTRTIRKRLIKVYRISNMSTKPPSILGIYLMVSLAFLYRSASLTGESFGKMGNFSEFSITRAVILS